MGDTNPNQPSQNPPGSPTEPPPPPDTVAKAHVSLADGAKTGWLYLLSETEAHFTPDGNTQGDGGTVPLVLTESVSLADLTAAWPTASFAILPTPDGHIELDIKATPDAALILAHATIPDEPSPPASAPMPPLPVIRAKFRCSRVARDEYGNETPEFYADHGPGNEQWAKATPGGNLTMTISNPGAQGFFTPGKSYFLTFTEAQ